MTDQLTLAERAETQARQAAADRVVLAAEEFYAAAQAYGLNVTEARAFFYVPLALRVDAWLERSRRLIRGGPRETEGRLVLDPAVSRPVAVNDRR